jgi:outer membrane scaffolding protein for murein synthesis (MipA/OmpV family)
MRDAAGEPRFRALRISLLAAALFLGAVLLGLPPRAAAEMLPKWELGVGVGGLWMPDYRGSDEVRSYLLPFPYVIYRLDWLKVDREGVRSACGCRCGLRSPSSPIRAWPA